MPKTRKWTVLVYAVAKCGPDVPQATAMPRARRAPDTHYLNAKADEIVQALKDAAKGLDNVYIAYRIVYDHRDTKLPYYQEPPDYSEPIACILNPDPPTPPVEKRGWFPRSHNLASDMLKFYAWALPRCPAEHHAIFFWGHSLGPAGLFRSQGKALLPSAPSLDDVEPLQVCDLRDSCRKALVGMYGGNSCDESAIVEANPERSVTKPGCAEPARIDVVLFQSCWMSTLETAFQLKDSVRYVVASQSLVPFGYPENDPDPIRPPSPNRGRGVWPYRRLFDVLIRWNGGPDHPTELVEALRHHYEEPPMRVSRGITIPEVWPFPTVPLSLLNLDAIEGEDLAPKLGLLIHAIKSVKGLKAQRGDFMGRASLAVCGRAIAYPPPNPKKPDLVAGSIALVDLKAVCRALLKQNGLNRDECDALKQLQDTALVAASREAVDTRFLVFEPRRDGTNAPSEPLPRTGLGFGGVSFFYYPHKDRIRAWEERDDYIFPDLQVSQPFFGGLVLATEVENFMRKREWTSDWANNLAFDQV
jgi:hypothetical protein